MRIIIIVLAILTAAAGAYYSYHSRELFIQAALYSEAFSLSSNAKNRVSDYYTLNHVLPHDNEQAGLAPAHTIYGTNVKRLSIARDGVVLVQFNEDMNDSIMVFTPRINITEGTLNWTCSSDSVKKSVLQKLRPACVYTPATIESELMQAIASQDINSVRETLHRDANLETLINGNTPLMLAAKIGNVDVVSMLLEAGAKVDHLTINAERRTALMVAITNENADIVSLLLSNGASIDRKDYTGKSALDYARLTDVRNADARFQLMLAAQLNPLFAGREDFGKKSLTPAERRIKLTALHDELNFAANNCHAKRLLSVLTENGYSPAADDTDEFSIDYTLGSSQCSIKLTGLLRATTVWQETTNASLELSIDQCDLKAAEAILVESPDLSVLRARYGESFVFRAVRVGCTEILNMFLRRLDGDDHLPADLVARAIKQVPQHALLRTVSVLIEAGADITAVDESGLSPLATAIAFEQPVVAKFLIDAGADVAALTPSGSYPLIEATKKGYHHLVAQLIAKGADVNVRDELGRTALHAAVAQGRQRTVDILLRSGADTRIQDLNGIDAVVMAESKQYKAIQATLLEN